MVDSKNRTLDTTETSIDTLETIRELEGATPTTLQKRMDIPKSTLYYHLNTLEQRGYLVKDGAKYKLAMKFLVHGQYVKTREREFIAAQEATNDLSSELGEDTDFSVAENGQLIVLHYSIEESAKHGVGFELGRPLNLPTSASGRAILSTYPRSRVEEIVANHGFKGTEAAPNDLATLHDRLDAIRERGYAINDEEWIPGLCAVSGPVTYPDGSVLGALSVIIPSFRFERDDLQRLTSPLMAAVEDLEGHLSEMANTHQP